MIECRRSVEGRRRPIPGRPHLGVVIEAVGLQVATRQLRELARARGVVVELADLPPVEINAPAVELCLSNYISNAIKYSDPAKPNRWIRIEGDVRENDDANGSEIEVRVRDNGLGIPADASDKLFQRFFRAHTRRPRKRSKVRVSD